MLRAITKLLSLATVLTIGVIVIFVYREHTAEQRKNEELLDENLQLKQVVDRLTDEHRVAEMMVIDQKILNGIPQTTLLFCETARNGTKLTPKRFVISGNEVHLDAMVIKFQHDFVKQNDPLRGHSLALFTRIFGNHQSPDDATLIDSPGQIPGYYAGTDLRVSQFETDLWNNFWKLTNDTQYRLDKGVRISNGQGLWWPCDPSQLYTITIESDGGLNVTSEPVQPIYREALKQKAPGA
jgi:hypothetical protein